MINFIKQTKDYFERLNINENDIIWVGSKDGKYACSWNNFVEKFKDLEYHNGFGGQEIANDLVVVGKDWWIERHDYDGSEWWEFKKLPNISETPVEFQKVKGNSSWVSLEYINSDDDKDWE